MRRAASRNPKNKKKKSEFPQYFPSKGNAGVLRQHDIVHGVNPEKLRLIWRIWPTYVKLGQIMSMRSDMLPEAYCRELTRLRTQVKPLPFETIKDVIEKELGRPTEELFSEISPEPLGSASIAQVHPGRLKNGDKVVLSAAPAIKELWQMILN